MNLAPIVVITYKRVEHTKKVLQALAKNFLAEQSEIFVFSNAPNCALLDEGELKKEIIAVNAVRRVIKEYLGCFKKSVVIKRKNHLECSESICSAVNEIINQYGKVIVLEDDVITHKNFLAFMNEALNFYQNNAEIWNVLSYNPMVIKEKNSKTDVFLTRSFMPWGWATWKDRWDMVDWDRKRCNLLKINMNEARKYMPFFELAIRRDLLKGNQPTLYWDYIYSCSQLRLKKDTVFPMKSLSVNIGNDGTGETDLDDLELLQIDFNNDENKRKFKFTSMGLKNILSNDDIIQFTELLYYRHRRNLMEIEAINKRFWFYIWLSLKNKNISIEKYFLEKNMKYIAIYGMGYAGEILYEELYDSKIKVKYVIDRLKKTKQNEVPVCSPNENLRKVDAIIVTVTSSFNEIANIIEKKVNCPIVSLEDVLFETAINSL